MKNWYLYLCFFVVLFTAVSCSSGDDSSTPEPEPPDTVDPPEAASLVFPEQDSECTEGVNFTLTQSDVPFDWNDSANTTSYQLVVKNLDTQVSTEYQSSTSQMSVTLSRATPYSWYIVSRNQGTQTAQSPTWKFYNAGEAQSSYAPFPAELVSPAMGSTLNTTTNVTLQWNGSDVDNDIEDYTVLFGTENPPTTTEADDLTTTEHLVTVSSGNVYYWRIITHDAVGNNSTSEVFQFRIN